MMLEPHIIPVAALNALPLLAGVVGLCLLPWFPRAGRGAAVTGLILLITATLADLSWAFGLGGVLWSSGLEDLSSLLNYVFSFMYPAALLLLGFAATLVTRRAPEAQPGPGGPAHPGPWQQGAPGPPPPGGFPPQPGPEQYGPPSRGPEQAGPFGQPGQHPHGPYGGA